MRNIQSNKIRLFSEIETGQSSNVSWVTTASGSVSSCTFDLLGNKISLNHRRQPCELCDLWPLTTEYNHLFLSPVNIADVMKSPSSRTALKRKRQMWAQSDLWPLTSKIQPVNSGVQEKTFHYSTILGELKTWSRWPEVVSPWRRVSRESAGRRRLL